MEKKGKELKYRFTDALLRIGEDGTIPPLGRDLLHALGTAPGGSIHFAVDEEGHVTVKGIPPVNMATTTQPEQESAGCSPPIPTDVEQQSLFGEPESHSHRKQ